MVHSTVFQTNCPIRDGTICLKYCGMFSITIFAIQLRSYLTHKLLNSCACRVEFLVCVSWLAATLATVIGWRGTRPGPGCSAATRWAVRACSLVRLAAGTRGAGTIVPFSRAASGAARTAITAAASGAVGAVPWAAAAWSALTPAVMPFSMSAGWSAWSSAIPSSAVSTLLSTHLTGCLSVSSCKLDLQLTAEVACAIEVVHCVFCIARILELYVGKAPHAPGVVIHGDVYISHGAVLREHWT